MNKQTKQPDPAPTHIEPAGNPESPPAAHPSFAYVGEVNEVEFYGITFPRGVPVEVPIPAAVKKLETNTLFERVG